MTRPTKLTPEVQEVISRELRIGMTRRIACEVANVDYATFARWMQKAETPGDDDPSVIACREFRDVVRKAEAESVRSLAAEVRKAVKRDWRAAAWLLERRCPEDYARRTEISGPNGGPIEVADVSEQVKQIAAKQAAGLSGAELGIPADLDGES
jgi:hypothetical protein